MNEKAGLWQVPVCCMDTLCIAASGAAAVHYGRRPLGPQGCAACFLTTPCCLHNEFSSNDDLLAPAIFRHTDRIASSFELAKTM